MANGKCLRKRFYDHFHFRVCETLP